MKKRISILLLCAMLLAGCAAEKEAESRAFDSLRGRFSQRSCMEKMEKMLMEASKSR